MSVFHHNPTHKLYLTSLLLQNTQENETLVYKGMIGSVGAKTILLGALGGNETVKAHV